MDFSNVNQSEKQAETEMVWKCRFNTRTHTHTPPHTHSHILSRAQFRFGATKADDCTPITAAVRRGKQSQIATQVFSLPAAVLGIALGGCLLNLVRAWPGSVDSRNLSLSPSGFWPLLWWNFPQFRGSKLADPPAMFCPSYCFALSSHIQPPFLPSEEVLAWCSSFTPLSSLLVKECPGRAETWSWTWAGP